MSERGGKGGLNSGERGAILVHVAFSLLALMAFSAFVLDYGVLWNARRQAQNAADAGALAGAISLQVREGDSAATGTAAAVATLTRVWGEAAVTESTMVTSPASDCTPPQKCIRVNVYRDAAHNNALPMFFGNLFGRAQQNIKAMAIAKVGTADSTDCLKPIAVPDKWTDTNGNKIFDGSDQYIPPTQSGTTGYTLADVGTVVHLKDDPGGPSADVPKLDSGWYRLIDIVGGTGGGANEVRQAIASCVSDTYGINDEIPKENGEKEGARDALLDLYDLDPNAYFDNVEKKVVNSCAAPGGAVCNHFVPSGNRYDSEPAPGLLVSPRVMALPVFDPKIQAMGGTDSQGVYHPPGSLVLVNIFGFFLIPPTTLCGPYQQCTANVGKNDFKDIWGVLATRPEIYRGGNGNLDPSAAFILSVYLIR